VRADLFLPVDEEMLDSTEDEVFATHEHIVAAIAGRDRARASAAAETHVLRVRELVDHALAASGISARG
jgi:DNA-binding GntR family transcriptional regulator